MRRWTKELPPSIQPSLHKQSIGKFSREGTWTTYHQPQLQSAYRVAHSTETAIIKIHNDIVNGIDKDQCTILASLDLSAAGDTVYHNILQGTDKQYIFLRAQSFMWCPPKVLF